MLQRVRDYELDSRHCCESKSYSQRVGSFFPTPSTFLGVVFTNHDSQSRTFMSFLVKW